MVFLIFVLSLISFAASNVGASIEFSSKLSQLMLGQNSELITNVPLSAFSGSVFFDTGSVVSGSGINFLGSGLSGTDNDPLSIQGSFLVDTTTQPLNSSFIGTSPITFVGLALASFKRDLPLQAAWSVVGETIFDGNDHTLDMSHAAALINIAPNSRAVFKNLTISGFEMEKLVCADATATITFLDTTMSLAKDSTSGIGNMVVLGDCYLVMNTNDVLLSSAMTFTVNDGSSLWIDNRASGTPAVFAKLVLPTGTATLIDNIKVRVLTDVSQSQNSSLGILTGGSIPPVIDLTHTDTNAGYPVVLTGNSALNSSDQIIVNNNVTVQGNGSSITFNNSAQSQVVVPPNKSITFDNVQLLRVTQSTFQMHEGSVVRFTNNTVLEYVEDVHYEAGTFAVIGDNSSILLRGLGGKKKITLGSDPSGTVARWLLGVNTMILEDIEIVGLHYFSFDTKIVNNRPMQGKLVLTGQARLNIDFDTEMPMVIRGDANKLIFRKNNLTLFSKIRFDNGYDGTLHIGFSLSSDAHDLSFSLGKDALYLSSENSLCNLILDDDTVTIINKSTTSFVVKTRSIFRGGVVQIKQNPILQETPEFVLAPGLDLQTDLLVPIELTYTDNSMITKDNSELLFSGKTTKGILVPRPVLTVKTAIKGKSLSNTVAVKPGGTIKSFAPSRTAKMSLILEGNSSVTTALRRSGIVSIIARDTFTTDDVNKHNLDVIKTDDSVFVTGTGNRIKITGLMSVLGKIVLDENAELIFEFDDSTDFSKAIFFGSSVGAATIELPPSSSIVFEGSGSVFFDNQSRVVFKGTPIELQESLGNGLYVDDRPSLIFRSFAQLKLDSDMDLFFSGNGKVLFQDGAICDVALGMLKVGKTPDDFFDIVIDKRSILSVGVRSGDSTDAYFSMADGIFNLKFDRDSELRINNFGTVEFGLNQGVVTQSRFGSVSFDQNSKITATSGGVIAFGQRDLSEVSNVAAKFSWSSPNLLGEANGSVAFYLSSSSTPFVKAQLQGKGFVSGSSSPYEVFKRLVRKSDALIFASDYVDTTDGVLKLLTTGGAIVSLNAGDVLTSESSLTGNVYGTTIAGRRFGITPAGVREFYG